MATNTKEFRVKNGLEISSGPIKINGSSGSSGQVLSSTGSGVQWIAPTTGSGTGDVVGPASSTINAVVRFDGTTGKLIKNSTVTLSDTGILTVPELSTTSITSTGGNPIIIAPDSTGDVHLNADSVRIGDNNTDATLITRGTGDLLLTTNEGSAVEGVIRIYDGANGNITLTPNGTGQVQVGSDQVVTRTASQTLTNKSLSGSSNTFTSIPNSATTATSANTASAIVARDASGNFSAGTITATLSGNASTATNASILTTTNQGKTGGIGLVTVSSTTAWSDYPIGFSAMFLNNQTATGTPSTNYGYFIKVANRDGGGGWGGIWVDYSGGDTYVGNTTVSSSYATWYKLLSSTNYSSYALPLSGGTISGNLTVTGISNASVQPRTGFSNWINHNISAYTDASLISRGNTEDSWIWLDQASAQWGIYHRQIDSDLANAGQPTLPANSVGYVGGNNLTAYLCMADGRTFAKGGFITPDTTNVGLRNMSGTSWIYADDTNGNMWIHNEPDAGGMYFDSDNYYIRYRSTTVVQINSGGMSVTGTLNTSSTLSQGGNQVLHAGNYTSYLNYGNPSSRGVYEISNWNQTTYPNAHFLSGEGNIANSPTTDFHYGIQTSFHRSGNAYRTQFVTSLYSDTNIYARNSRDGDVWTSWKLLLHSGNFSSYAVNRNGDTTTGVFYFTGNKGSNSYLSNNSSYSLQAYSSDGGAAAMSFHRSGYYAVNMGLDPDNIFRIGGWSASANRLQLDMSGNLTVANNMYATAFAIQGDTNNSFTQGGLQLRDASATIYLRDTNHNSAMIHCNSNIFYILRGGNDTTTWATTNGYWPLEINLTNNDATFGRHIYAPAGYIHAVHFNQTSANSENPTVDQVIVTNGDNYFRKASKAHFKAQTGMYHNDGTSTANRIIISTSTPTGTITNGDVWLQY